METDLYKALSWQIDNFSEKNDKMMSKPFSSGGCNWCLTVYPKGCLGYDDLILYLEDADSESLKPGWKRRAKFCFLLLNQSGQELYRSPDQDRCRLFCSEVDWGNRTKMTLTKLQDNGLLENDQLIIQVYMNVLEVVHQGKSTENDMLDYHGVQITASQCALVDKLLKEHLEVDPNIKPKNEKTFVEYTKLFVGLIQRLIIKSPQSLSVTELSNAQNELTQLTDAGFKVDWLRSKLEERKKQLSDRCRVEQLHERVKNVKLAFSELKSAAAAAIFSSFELIEFLIRRFFLSCFSSSKH